MKLTKVHITNFQSIHDSTEFEVGNVTCLVGKNEAGKTALLKALYRLNPVVETEGDYNSTDDYPRRDVSDYEADVETGRIEPARVIKATYMLEADDIEAVEDVFGPECLVDEAPSVILTKGYSNKRCFNRLKVNQDEGIRYWIENAELTQSVQDRLSDSDSLKGMVDVLTQSEQTETVQELLSILQNTLEHNFAHAVYNRYLRSRVPKFLYFDEYYQLKGQDNLDSLRTRISQNALESSDHPLIGLIDLAGIDLDRIADPGRTENLLNRLEAAENRLTQQMLSYWSQNRHLRMTFDIRAALPEDPENMRSGTNIWARVRDTKHMVSTGLGTRSRGFVWFFSFLAWYSQLQRKGENLILLLDEPGLSLHAKAQGDLLRYFEEALEPNHQLLYTTHSPFMVDPQQFSRVRIVQDRSIEENEDDLPEEDQGTKVTTEVLDATADSLFPLQGALGYEIYQTLFIGPNNLVVEGVSDLLYIQTISELLQSMGKDGLSTDWTVTPVGGSDKVPTFVALIGAQQNLNVAVLVDYQKKDQQVIQNLYKRRLLDQSHVVTFADFVSASEADIEDMFEPPFYLTLVNGVYGSTVSESDIPAGHPRIIRRLERFFENSPLSSGERFNHFRPARYFADKVSALGSQLSDTELDRFQKAFDKLNSLL